MIGSTDSLREWLDVGWPDTLRIPPLDLDADGPTRIRSVAATDFPLLAIPSDFGGIGLDLLGVAAAQRMLAMVDPSVAIALNMHSLTVGLMSEYWRQHHDTSWLLLEGIAGSHALVASAFAEPNGSANFLNSLSVATPSEGGYRVTGVKYPCSLATTAEIFCMSATVKGTTETIVALCPATSPGLSIAGSWPSIGMQSSDTARVVLEDVLIDDRLVFHRAPAATIDDTVISGVVWFSVLLAGTYHGLLTALVLAATDALRSRGGLQRMQLLGRAAREVFALGAEAQRLATLWQTRDLEGRTALAAAMSLRAGLSDTRDRVVTALTPVLGSKLYTETDPAGQLALDLLAVHHHPPTLIACDEAVASFALDQEMSFDPTS